MTFKKGETPPGAKPFKKGQSGNPGGRPKSAKAQEEWRRQNTARAMAQLTEADIDRAFLRWWSAFAVSDPKALWMKDIVFEVLPQPKPVEPEKPADPQADGVVVIEERTEKPGAG